VPNTLLFSLVFKKPAVEVEEVDSVDSDVEI